MPRPTKALDLIRMEEGAPQFRNGLWFDGYREGKVFYPSGFRGTAMTLGISSGGQLEPFLEAANKVIKDETRWHKELKDGKGWQACALPQVKAAASNAPMILTKALQCIVALELYAKEEGVIESGMPVDIYDTVHLVPGVYGVSGLNAEQIETEKAALSAFEDAAVALAQDKAKQILLDVVVKKQHVPYSIAKLITVHFPGATIHIAQRKKGQGMMPASENVIAP